MKPRVPLKPPKMIEVTTDVDRVTDPDTTIETAAIPEGDPTAATDITGATDVSFMPGRMSATLITQRVPGDETDELAVDDDPFAADEPTRDDQLLDDEN